MKSIDLGQLPTMLAMKYMPDEVRQVVRHGAVIRVELIDGTLHEWHGRPDGGRWQLAVGPGIPNSEEEAAAMGWREVRD